MDMGIIPAMIWFGAGAGATVVVLYAVRLSSAWSARGRIAATIFPGRSRLAALPLDTHIASEWTDGRRRLDALLVLIEALAVSLEREVAKLNRLDPSDPVYERDARRVVTPALRRFTFDQHLRNECRELVPLLEFCGRDLADSQGLNTTEQLAALAEIKAAIGSVDRA